MVARFYSDDVDYLSNTLEPTFPDGLDIEIIRASSLAGLAKFELTDVEREHVTLGIYSRPAEFSCENFRGIQDLSNKRWTVDYLEDLVFIRQVYGVFQGRESIFTLEDVLLFLDSNPKLQSEISADRRNEQLGDI